MVNRRYFHPPEGATVLLGHAPTEEPGPQRDNEWTTLYALGWTTEQIGSAYRLTKQRISARLQKLNATKGEWTLEDDRTLAQRITAGHNG